MGFLNRGNSAIFEGGYDNSILDESIANIEEIMPKYENFDEAALNNILETNRNFENIMEAIAFDEMDYYETTGKEIVYEAGGLSNFFGKVKAFFVNLYQKIKGLFKKFIALIDSYVKSDKEFVEKYRKHLLNVDTKGFEYKGYKFDDGAISTTAKSLGKAMDSAYAITSLPDLTSNIVMAKNTLSKVEDQTETANKMRAAALKAIGKSTGTTVEAGEMNQELFEHFRGEKEKTTLEKIDVSTQLKYITNYQDAKNKAKENFTSLERSINDTLTSLNKLEKEALDKYTDNENSEGQSEYIRLIHTVITFTKTKLNIGQTINGALLTALKDRSRQAKSICVSLMNYKPKAKNESAGYYDEGATNYGNALDSVVIR